MILSSILKKYIAIYGDGLEERFNWLLDGYIYIFLSQW